MKPGEKLQLLRDLQTRNNVCTDAAYMYGWKKAEDQRNQEDSKKLVLIRTYTDECTYYTESFLPFSYTSKENFLVDLRAIVLFYLAETEKLNTKWAKQRHNHVHHNGPLPIREYPIQVYDFNGMKESIDITDFIENGEYVEPVVYTLDEWFDKFSG